MNDLSKIVQLPPIDLRTLNTIVGALKLAEVRYGMLRQLPRWEDVPALSVDELGDVADVLDGLFVQMVDTPERRQRRWRLGGRARSNVHRLIHRRNRK